MGLCKVYAIIIMTTHKTI